MIESDGHNAQGDVRKEEAFAWLMRLTSGEATAEDAEALERWRRQDPSNEAALVHASKLWRSVGPAVEQAARREGRAFKFGRLPRMNAAMGRRAMFGGAVAAAAAYVLVRPPFELWPSFSELASDYRTGTGERRNIAMVGGTRVELNTETSLDVRSASGDVDRIELISGEVAVATDGHASKPVVVTAANGRATASDATFNMRCAASAVCITCVAGSVRVEHRGRAVVVQERQQVSYADSGLGEAQSVDPAVVTAWRDGFLVFHDESLASVIDEVNRYRPGRIIVTSSDLGRRLVSARFKLTRLQDVITQVQQVFGANVTRLPGGIILLSA